MNKKSREKQNVKANKGITLIALVVTIVVLIILAGITIASITGEKGIIKEARTAKELSEKAALEEQVELAIIKAEQKYKNPTIDNVIEEIKNNKVISNSDQVNKENGDILSDLGYLITGKLDDYIGKTSTGDNEGGGNEGKNEAPIPEGFYHAGGTIEEGFVISDIEGDDLNNSKHGNQFVWVPVPDINNFKEIGGYWYGSKQDASYYSEPYEKGYSTEKTEYDTMKTSVEKNHGFYIGRYEAGKDTDGSAVIKKNMPVFNYIGWNNSLQGNMTLETGGAVEVAKNFVSDKSYKEKVISTLVYGAQWDATLQFMDENYIKGECTENSYARNSNDKGNYYTGTQTAGIVDDNLLINTGSNENYAVKNIYDMAGNVQEWTMEASGSTGRVTRGGCYPYKGSDCPASGRSGYQGYNPNNMR